MLKRGLFKKPRNALENTESPQTNPAPNVPDALFTTCPGCKKHMVADDLKKNLYVCPACGKHLPFGARERVQSMVDEGSFIELDSEMTSSNLIGFPAYERKLEAAKLASGEQEAVICGRARIGGMPCCVFAMESRFMMGSMGTVAGEKITRLFEEAAKGKLPVIGFTVSGGARMQEGILSLMQMAKTSGAVQRHSAEGNLYICVLCDPTTGGVTASFAMESDIALAEPGALICFAGPRVIEQTIRQKLPQGFQSAEFLLERGFVDAIVPRSQQKDTLRQLLAFHQREDAHAGV